MLSIGSFAKISGVSPNALRYYDEIDLIKPIHINTENGYRYYDVSQLKTLLLISKLKSYQLSLEEISEILQKPDDDVFLLSLIKEKRKDIRTKLHHLNYTLSQLEQDITSLERGNHIMSNLDKIQVLLKETKPQNILFIRKKMSTQDCSRYLYQLSQTAQEKNLTVIGAPINIFHHEEEFNPDCYDNEVAIPVAEETSDTRELAGGLCAMATLHGPYTELRSVYTKLQQWVEKEGYVPSSDSYEVYLTDPGDTAPEENITEVYVPVKQR